MELSKTQKMVSEFFKDEEGKRLILSPKQAEVFDLIFKRQHSRNVLLCDTRWGKSFVVGLAVLLRVATFAEKWCIVAPSNKKARIIMGIIIQHVFDNEYIKDKLQFDDGESLDRLRRERSKERLTFKHSDGTMGEVYILSADSRNKLTAGDSLMGFGCIPEGYLIKTDKGEFDIKELVERRIDCKILSYNHKTNKEEYKEIISYQKNKTVNRFILEFDVEGAKFRCTNDHPVYVEGKGYIRAEEVKQNDVVRLA